MKKLLLVIALLLSFVGTSVVVSSAFAANPTPAKKVVQQKKNIINNKKKDTKKKTVKPTRQTKKVPAKKTSTNKNIKCVGPDGKVAYAPQRDCDNLWNFWNKNKPSSQSNNGGSSNNHQSNSNNNSNNSSNNASSNTSNNSSVSVPTQAPTPTITVVPTAIPTPTVAPAPEKQFTLNVSTFEIPSGGQGLQLVSHNGNMWFTVDRTGPNVYKYPENVVYEKDVVGSLGFVTPTGEVTEYFLPTGSNKPVSLDVGEYQFRITEGPDGKIWFTQPNANIIGNLTDDGLLTEFDFTGLEVEPHAITAGPDGNIYFMDLPGGITGMETDANIFGQMPSVSGYSMVSGADGSLWVGGQDVYKFASDGTMSTYDLAGSGGNRAVKIINGANNDVWVSQNGGHLTNVSSTGVVTTYETPGFQAWNLTMDANNNVWYKETGSNKIYSLNTTTGNISSYLITTDDYFLTWDIAAGSDGNIWYTGQGQVGKIDISNVENVFAAQPYSKDVPIFDPWISNVTANPCTSSSCEGLITLTIDGFYFPADAQVSLRGRTLDQQGNPKNNYTGQIVNRVGNTNISADFQNLACDTYDVIVYSDASKKIVVHDNMDLKPYTCN